MLRSSRTVTFDNEDEAYDMEEFCFAAAKEYVTQCCHLLGVRLRFVRSRRVDGGRQKLTLPEG
jgi:hypothetical protein